MAEKTGENSIHYDSLAPDMPTPEEECESARILEREGLFEEAKHRLFRVLTQHPHHEMALKILESIQKNEVQKFLREPIATHRPVVDEAVTEVIERLAVDLGIDLDDKPSFRVEQAVWHLNESQVQKLGFTEWFDLGVHFYQMDCFQDAYDAVLRAERAHRRERGFLDADGVGIYAMLGRSLIRLNRAFEAKQILMGVLHEPELNLELRAELFLVMSEVEKSLGSVQASEGWLQKAIDISSLEMKKIKGSQTS